MISAFIAQGVYVIHLIYKQCTVDLFFVDWETSKSRTGGISGTLRRDESDETVDLVSTETQVSIWRTLFVANQWKSLQIYRRVHVPLTLVCLYVILTGWKVKYVATPQPNISNLTPDKTSPILQFSINSLVWWGLCFAQFSFRYLIMDRFYRHKILQYIDLLSLSNISLLILDESCHGMF